MDFYGRIIQVSFGKEDEATNGDDGNGEFTALRATSGEPEREGPALDPEQALPAVQPPVSALGSLSSGALSSGPAAESLPGRSGLGQL